MAKKDTYYFSHDYNARNDEKILELRANYGAEGYGIFWMVVEAMAEGSSGGLKATHIGGLALGFGIPKHKLLEILAFCIEISLFYDKDGNYYSARLLTHKEYRNSLSKWGKKGAEIRKGGLSTPPTKEIKGNEIENTGVVPEMFEIFKKHNPKYPQDKQKDFTSCLQIAYRIGESKGFEKEEILNGKKKEILKSWETIVVFAVSDSWFSKRSLSDLSKEWQRLIQSMHGNVGTNKKSGMIL